MNKDFKTKGYCVVKSAISEELREFITQYALFDEMNDFSIGTDWMVPTAHSKYSDCAMESLLIKLQPLLEKESGLTLLPTYSYYRVYRNGDSLEPHYDRDSCEISCTVSFDFSYDHTSFEWPIFINKERIVLNPGDLACYRGVELNHWREKLVHEDPNVWHVQGFFHYVDANGPYKEWAYDKRSNIGIKHRKQFEQRAQKPYIEYT